MSTTYFLALDGVHGDSLNSTYKGWFEVNNFDIDLAGAAASAGTAAFSPLTLTLDSNSGLAPLLALAATGDRLNGATLVGVTDGVGQAKVYQLDLADVLLANVEHHADPITEVGPTLTLDYSKIELQTFTQNGTGGLVPEGQFGFDLAANTDGITVPSADPGGSVAASPQPMDYFMLIDGLNGGSPDAQHIGWFEIKGVDLDIKQLAAGDFASLNVIVPAGVELSDVMQMVTLGGVTGVHIEGFTAGRNATKVYDLTLADVTVTRVGVNNVAGSESLDYSLSLDYGKIALVTNGIDSSGNPVKNGEFGYDVTNHTEIPPFSLALTPGTESSFASASRYFLKVDDGTGLGVPGDSSLSNEPGEWLEVTGFDFDIQNVQPGTAKPAFSPLTLTLATNTALAPLLTMAGTGPVDSTSATLIGVRADGEPITFQLDLGPVFVTKVEDVAGAGLTVSLGFGRITLHSVTLDPSGVVSPGKEFFWDPLADSVPTAFQSIPPSNTSITDVPATFQAIRPSNTSITGIASSPEPATYFMLIDGLNGGSADQSHKGWFEISRFDFDLTNLTIIANGAVVGGKPNFSPLNVTVSHEAGLADVMDVAATGGLVQGVRIEGFTGGTSPAEVYELNLADVAVTKVADGEGDGYSLSLDYGKIALVTRDQTGQPISDGAFGYDLARNVAINPFSLNLSPDNSGGPVAPAKYFLAINGVKGDSLDANHKGWFEVSNFDIDLDNPFVGIPGVVQPGKAAFSPLTLTLDGNTALAPLLTMAATGDPLQGATLVGVTEGAEQDNVYRLDLADVRVTKVNDDAEADLTFRLDYSKIELETFTQNGTGGLVPEGQFGFDLAANTDGITVPSADPGGSVAASPQPARYFMVIDGVNGGSPDKQHLGWFEISGFDLDLAKSTVVGGGTGTAAFSPLNVVLPQETGLADVMDLAATGGLVKGVRIEGFTGGVTPAEVYELTLADVGVTKVADNENGGFSLSLDYGKISLVTNGIDQTGKPTKNGEFAYDVTNHTAIAPFSLNLSPSGNQAPVANAQSISTDEDTAVAVTLSGSDADGDSLTFTVVSAPAHGTLSGTGANLTYAPAANYNGPDAFTYKVNDGQVDSNIATVSLTVNPVNDADLSVTMTDGRTTVVPSTSDTYTIVVSNAGPNDVTGANVSDMLPAGVTSATWALTASNGGGSVSGPTSGSGALATTVDLPSGSSVIFSFNVEVNPLATGALVNTATVSPPAGTTDPNPGNNSATDTDTLAPQADLAVTMDDGRITVAPGTSDTYTIRVTNNGPSTVTSLTLTDSIPAALLNTSFAPSVGVYNIGTGVWSGLSLASGQSVSMTLSGTIDPNASGLLTNTVTVNPPAGTTDTNLANNSVTDTDTLGTPSATADLAVAITDGTTIVVPGAIDTYTITVTNNGPDTVNSLTLIEAIPAALSSPIFAPSVGAYDVGTGVWSGLSLATGQSVSMSLSGVINPNATGTLTNIVAVAGTTDTNPANNAATDTDTVALPADLAVTITDAATTLVPGSVNTYTITVSNNGPGTISNFNLIDAIPDALLNATFGSPSAGSYDPGSGLWSGLSLASGQSVFITLSGVIGIATGTLTNTVMVSALIDPNPGNNTASDTNTLTLFSSPHPPPPPATSANMILRRGDGLYAIYDIGNNATLDAHPLAQVGSDWQFAGLGSVQAGGGTAMFLRQQNGPGATGSFEIYNISNNNVASAAPLGQLNGEVQGIGNFGSRGENDVLLRNGTAFVVADVANDQITGMAPLGTVGLNWQLGGFGNFSGNPGAYDMLLRDSNSGGLQVYDIANSQIINSAFVGAVGLDWQISGFGNFSSRPGETDMIMRNANTGGLQLYDIANNQITGTAFLGTVGLEWQFAGVASIHGPGTSDLILRNVNTGAFEAYNIANNQITGAASLGQVGLEWQVGGFAVDPAAASMGSSGSTSQLVEAMAGFGGTSGAGESLNTAPLNADTSQQTLLTTPQHA